MKPSDRNEILGLGILAVVMTGMMVSGQPISAASSASGSCTLSFSGSLDSLHQLVAEHYPYVIDLDTRGDGRPLVIASGDLPALERIRNWNDGRIVQPSTDLVLVREIDPGWRQQRSVAGP